MSGDLACESYPTSTLSAAYARLCAFDGLYDTAITLERDRHRDEHVYVTGDWIERVALDFALRIALELELELVVTSGGLRLSEHTDDFSEAVRDVKRTIAEGEDE